MLNDLSKAFDCLNHKLLIAKLNTYGFTLTALKLIHDYLSERKQRTRVNNSYSTWFGILFGVQGFILGPLLFNLFLADLFFIVNTIDAKYAYHNTPYTSSNDINKRIKSLEEALKELFKCFVDNPMKRNPGKCHLFVSTNDNVAIRIENFQVENSKGKSS